MPAGLNALRRSIFVVLHRRCIFILRPAFLYQGIGVVTFIKTFVALYRYFG
jgi:hypothetical protein